jgi:DMSO/TMAO reductase YedYZ molybdopterin-dependent catalytic subunit
MEVAVALFRSSQDRKAREAGVDESRIPPGQYYTDKWPVLHAGGVPAVDLRTWDFRVFGLVRNEIRLSFDELVALGTQEQTSDIHCVTRWTKLDMPWKGVPMRAVLEQAQPLDSARFVIAHAEQGFTANLPIEAVQADDAMLAYEAEGQPLTPEHGYPLRLLVPSRYFWKSAKWLRGLEVSDVDRPGFWEGYGYHNDADPWKEERYGF